MKHNSAQICHKIDFVILSNIRDKKDLSVFKLYSYSYCKNDLYLISLVNKLYINKRGASKKAR